MQNEHRSNAVAPVAAPKSPTAPAAVVDEKRASGYALNSDGGLVVWGRVKAEQGSGQVYDISIVLPYHATAQSTTFHKYAYARGAFVAVQKKVRELMVLKYSRDEVQKELTSICSKGMLDTLVPTGKKAQVDPVVQAQKDLTKLTSAADLQKHIADAQALLAAMQSK